MCSTEKVTFGMSVIALQSYTFRYNFQTLITKLFNQNKVFIWYSVLIDCIFKKEYKLMLKKILFAELVLNNNQSKILWLYDQVFLLSLVLKWIVIVLYISKNGLYWKTGEFCKKKIKKNDCLFLVVWFLQSRTSNNCLQHDSV